MTKRPPGGAGSRRGPRHAPKPAAKPSRWRVRRRVVWPLFGGVVAIAVLFLGVFPTRTYLAQRSAIARAEEQLDVLTAENDRLEDRVDALNTPEEIERIAREEFDLVKPGEQPYVVLPPAEAPVAVPSAWPFGGLADALGRQR